MNQRIRLQGAILHAPAQDERNASELPAADVDTAERFRQSLARRGLGRRDAQTPDDAAREQENAGESVYGAVGEKTDETLNDEKRAGEHDGASSGHPADETLSWIPSDARERMMASADAPPGTVHPRPHHHRTPTRRSGASGASAPSGASALSASQDADAHDEETTRALIDAPQGLFPMSDHRQRFDDRPVPERVDETAAGGQAGRAVQRVAAPALHAIVDTVAQALASHRTTSAHTIAQSSAAAPREIVVTLDPSVLPDTRLQLQLSGGALSLRFETSHRQSVALLSDQATALAQRVFRRTGRAVTVSLNGETLAGSHRFAS
ncbi:type III secretion HpaP family protein [Pandoraea anhela]|uniref:Uncharacterized protein n=1 Tax=Pandoraea anhela TaxID=2508295 RepID=A0A5E4RW32_9BURK|nr:type III secretion HpaP family protein [Pandoraea anhela]VVD66159.1 hypothetical protein PAN31108_00368 [Pandoraea anhela]